MRGGKGERVPRRAGVALLAAASIVGALLSSCSIIGASGSGTFSLVAYFTRTVSLYNRSEVRVLGMKVGTVQQVDTEGDRVRVTMSVAKDVPLPRAVLAAIVPQSLLGARYIQLYPAWVEGQPRLDPSVAEQRTIDISRTAVPAEPDEALTAVKHLLDSLDPTATGRLVTNLSQDLRGNGQNLNDAVRSLSAVSTTLAAKDQQLVALIDNLQELTSVLDTRETQLGTVMDLFAQTTSLLAKERGTIASLVTNLAALSGNALDLVSKHAAPLQTDINTLNTLVATLDANLNNVSTLLTSLPTLAAGPNLDGKGGFIAAYNPTYHRLDLRDSLGSTVNGLLQALGLPLCLAIPLLNVTPTCAPGNIVVPLGLAAPAVKPNATPPTTAKKATTQAAVSPLGGVLNLLGSGGTAPPQLVGYGLTTPPPAAPRQGMVATLARWSHNALGQLW